MNLLTKLRAEYLVFTHLVPTHLSCWHPSKMQLRDEVISEAAAWSRRHGVTGVPFFVINGKTRVSGAQDPAVFEGLFRDIAEAPGV